MFSKLLLKSCLLPALAALPVRFLRPGRHRRRREFPAPLYAKWAADYNKATGVRINYQSVGSGAGIKQIEAKTVDFGASDVPLKDEELAKEGLSSSRPSSAAWSRWSTSRASSPASSS